MAYAYKKIKLTDGSTIDEHRLVMQNHLGRKLRRNEVVHHKDGNKRNNCLSNLEIMSLSDHSKMHYNGGDLSPKMIHSNLTEEQKESKNRKLRMKNLGFNSPNSKLSKDDVIQVMGMIEAGESKRSIAKKFNCHHASIRRAERSYKKLESLNLDCDS